MLVCVSPIRPTVQVIGRRRDPDGHRLRDFLTRTAQPHRWLDADSPEGRGLLAERGVPNGPLPVLIDGERTFSPASVRAVATAWNATDPPARSNYDLAIVGAGPAGLAAAVYAASDGLATILIERDVPGGQASHTSLIENFFGFPDGIGGAELARRAGRQAERFGAEIVMLRGVVGHRIETSGEIRIALEGEIEIGAAVGLAAPGMEWRRLEAPGVEELLGRGVYYGAGRSEAEQCGGDPVVTVGAGNSAGQAVLNLADAGARVTMAVRGPDLGRSMSAYLVERIGEHPLIDVRLRTQVTAAHADGDHLGAVSLTGPGDAVERVPARALFLCIGGIPRSGWAAGAGVRTNEAGYVLTGPDLLEDGRRPPGWPLPRDPVPLETSEPGFFVAGDVRAGSTKRVAGAVGEGAMAVALAHRRLAELREGPPRSRRR